jgi:ActR/RegA family two-component response regulator
MYACAEKTWWECVMPLILVPKKTKWACIADSRTIMADTYAGTVLLVDDDANFRLCVQRLFRSRGWNAYGARHGREACELYGAIQPDVTFVDIVMPGGSGEACVRQLLNVDPQAVIYA